jgi:exodeoxyribonuclease-5
MISVSKDQRAALEAIAQWLRSPSDFITLGGYAGTGKTTMLAIIRKLLAKSKTKANKNIRIAFASFTGRATQNLHNTLKRLNALSGKDSCSTIHSLLYYQIVDKNGSHVGWRKRNKLDFDLIIIDEASMVTRELWQDLLSYQIPIIAVGDHGQLPPVGESFNLMEKPQLRLEKIHRQAVGDPILDLATKARLGEPIPYQRFSAKVKKIRQQSEDAAELLENTLAVDRGDALLLVGRNKTRVMLNAKARIARGYETQQPIVRDKVVCLRNVYENEDGAVYNGMLGEISFLENHDQHRYRAEIIFPDDERNFTGFINKSQFGSPTTMDRKKIKEHTGDLFDFGYALTVHKAQGSQARKVLLFDESYCFKEDAAKWLYTGITRAEEELYILG